MKNEIYTDPYPKMMELLNLSTINNGKDKSIVTSPTIAREKISLLPDEMFTPESKFLDICCKSGIFLTTIRERLMNSPIMIEAIPNYTERYKYITDNQLYGIAPNEQCKMYSVRAIYGTLKVNNPHILCFGDYEAYRTACISDNHKILFEEMFTEFRQIEFDAVIGNPSYNIGADINFVDLGYKLSNNITAMIPPTK